MPVRSGPLLLTLLCLQACGKDDNHTTTVQHHDAGLDAQVPDGSADAQSGSGGLGGSGGSGGATEEDAGPSEPFDPSKDCDVVAEKSEFSAPVMFDDEAGYALTPGLTGFGVAYQSNNCGAISVLPVASTGDYPQPTELYGDCATVAQGVSLVHEHESYRMAWVDNAAGSSELQVLQLSDALKPPADSSRMSLTSNALRELAPVQASIASKEFVGWISNAVDSKKRAIMLRGEGAEDALTLVEEAATFNPTKLALAQLGTDSGAVAFVSEQAQPGVWLVPITSAGAPRSAPVRLNGNVSTGNTVDIATREEDGGAVIYSLDIEGRQEVRFRRVSSTGAFLSDEVKVVTFPLEGRDASIARLGGGYVVAFRSFSESGAAKGEVRLTFVSKEGNLQKDSNGRLTTYSIAEASTSGGRVTARVSRDGQLLVGFLDIDPDGVQGPQFRLIRKRLDCAL